MIASSLGLAVVPTYLVVRSHNPDETTETNSTDEFLDTPNEVYESEKQ